MAADSLVGIGQNIERLLNGIGGRVVQHNRLYLIPSFGNIRGRAVNHPVVANLITLSGMTLLRQFLRSDTFIGFIQAFTSHRAHCRHNAQDKQHVNR